MRKMLYWDWIREEAKKINSDGCSTVPDFRVECCLEHDLGYFYGRSARSAYQKYLGDSWDPWVDASRATRWQIDRIFWACNCRKSLLGKWSLMSLWRLVGVRVIGWMFWTEHRRER
jgi:hypothetical protein